MKAALVLDHPKVSDGKQWVEKALREAGWWQENTDAVVEQRELILKDEISDEHREYVKERCKGVIYLPESDCWGIVIANSETKTEFRLTNAHVWRLRQGAEAFVKFFQTKIHEATLEEVVEVWETKASVKMFSGHILPENRLLRAIQLRQTKFGLAIVSLLAGLIVLWIASPSDWVPVSWKLHMFWQQAFERIATGLFVACIINASDVIVNWCQLRRKSVIDWTLDN